MASFYWLLEANDVDRGHCRRLRVQFHSLAGRIELVVHGGPDVGGAGDVGRDLNFQRRVDGCAVDRRD